MFILKHYQQTSTNVKKSPFRLTAQLPLFLFSVWTFHVPREALTVKKLPHLLQHKPRNNKANSKQRTGTKRDQQPTVKDTNKATTNFLVTLSIPAKVRTKTRY